MECEGGRFYVQPTMQILSGSHGFDHACLSFPEKEVVRGNASIGKT
jgi:hypothetical protein